MKKPGNAGDPLWYKDAVLYELHVRAFFDRNDDGIGDLPGLVQKLDYLEDLGVTCLWLVPFFPSPLRDDGYDISDYLNVHPMYGTMEDFKALLAAAHDRGLQVMIELVMNHSRISTHGFNAPGRRQKVRPNATITFGAIAIRNMATLESSSRIRKNQIGPGIPWPRRISGIDLFRTSPT